MNPDSPQTPREEMEQRLTALVLGELPADQAAELHRALAQDGELAKRFARLHHTVGLVRETLAKPDEPAVAPVKPLQLSAARREKLLAHFKTVTPPEFAPAKRRMQIRLLEVAAVLAICALLAAMLLPALSKAKSKAKSVAIQSNVRQIEFAKQLWAEDNKKSAGATPTLEDLKPYLGRGEISTVGGETYSVGKVGEPVVAELAPKNARGAAVASAAPTSDDKARASAAIAPAKPATTLGFRFGTSEAGARDKVGYVANYSDMEEVLANDAEADQPKRPAGVTPLSGCVGSQIVLPTSDLYYGVAGEGIGNGRNSGNQVSDNSPQSEGFFLQQSSDAPQTQENITQMVVQDEGLGAPLNLSEQLLSATSKVMANDDASSWDYRRANDRVDGNSEVAGYKYGAGTARRSESEQPLERKSEGDSGRYYRSLHTLDGNSVNSPAEAAGATISGGRFGIPQAGVTGMSGGGSGGGGSGLSALVATNSLADYSGDAANKFEDLIQLNEALAAEPPEVMIKAKFAEVVQNDRHVLGTDWHLGAQLTGEKSEPVASPVGTPASKERAQRTITTTRGRTAAMDANAAGTFDLPALTSGGVMTESGDSSIAVVGYVNVPAGRPATSVASPRAVAAATPQPTLATADANTSLYEAASDDNLQANSSLLAKTDRPEPAGKLAFAEKRRELQELTDQDRLLRRKIAVEKIDQTLPKSAQVEIIESADAKVASSRSGLGRLRDAISDDVERVASIKVERDKTDIDELSGARAQFNPYDPYFVATETEAMKSEAVLGKVVEKLKLDEAFARQKGVSKKLTTSEAVALLKDRLELRSRPNTTILDIRAKSSNPEEAAQIANEVALAYKNWRFEQEHRLVTAGAVELEKQLRQQTERIDQVKTELDQLRAELKLSDVEAAAELEGATLRKPATNAPVPQPEIQTIENNFSTFSLNVSDVSFKLAAASLENGRMPDAAAIRSEEFINAFDYRDPEPAAGAPIAFAWERSRYPFTHNRDLLRFSLKTAAAGRQAGRPLNIVLLLDNSGSMERADRVRTIREALRVLAGQLQPQDKLSVITFARTARLVVDGVSGSEAAAVAMAVSEITPQGGTNLEDAMNLAYQTAAKHYLANGINRVVLLTDGAANLGDVQPDSLQEKVEAQRKQGIALDCFGIGWDGLNDDLLEVLSRNGDGRYGFINSPEEAATDFVGQLAGALKVAASDVKVQVEFNPKRVTSYRQIGYAKHQLTKEQFRDNTVDAAEIAAQESGNALYTVEAKSDGVGAIGTVRVRYKVPGTTTYREQSWDVPYTGNAISLEQSSPAMRLAASASAFAEWLVASPFAGEVTPDALLNQLRGVPEVFGADSRPKRLEWMIRQAKSLEGK